MKSLSLDPIDTTNNPYPLQLEGVSIGIRGSKNIYDIFFSISDVETEFDISMSPPIDFAWVNTSSGKEKYMTYRTLKRVLYETEHPLASLYMAWVDGLISDKFSFSRRSTTASSVDTYVDESDIYDSESDIDDSDSVSIRDDYMVPILQHKVMQLEHQLELKDKDLQISQQAVQLLEKEIEIMKMKSAGEWV